MSDLSKSEITDEFGFVEVKIQEATTTTQSSTSSSRKLHELSLDELQKLCQQVEKERRKNEVNNNGDDDPWTNDSISVEKEIAVELLLRQNTNNNDDDVLHDSANYFLKQKVEQMSKERGHAVVSSKNLFDSLRSPDQNLSNKLDENKTEVEQTSSSSSNQELPSWLLNLEPEVQREFLEAMQMMVVGKK